MQVAGVLAGLATVVALVDPFKHHLAPPCPFHALTGLWCPFCGATRAVWAGAHGDLHLMLRCNALLPLILIAVGWGWLAWLGRVSGRWSLPVPSGRAFNIAAGGVLLVFTVVRNLPGLGALGPPALS